MSRTAWKVGAGPLTAIALLSAPAFVPRAESAEIKVLSAGAMKKIVGELAEEFQRETRHTVTIASGTAGQLRDRIAGGEAATVLAINEHTTYGKLVNMLVVLFAIYAVSSLVLRSPLGGAFVVMPIVVSAVVLFGVLGWSGIRLDMGSASLVAMSAGVGADYAIYFLYRLREERARLGDDAAALGAALRTSGRAVLFVATSISAGYAIFSQYP